MTTTTAKITKRLRLAMSSDHFVTEDEMPALRVQAVDGVKHIINRRNNTKSIVDEWLTAKAQSNKGRMR